MLFRISVVASLAALVVASPVAEAAGPLVVERSTTPGSFPANLARRFQSTVGLLRSRSAVKAAAVEEKRSVSDELVHMIKGEFGTLSSCRSSKAHRLLCCQI